MRRGNRLGWTLVTIITIVGLSAPSRSQAPPAGEGLVGVRGSSGERELQARGYDFIRTTTGDDRKWSYWWNAAASQCISVATTDGRYGSIVSTPAPDCGKNVRDDRGPGNEQDRGDRGYHPDIGYPSSAPPRGGPSDPQPNDYNVQVQGQRVDLGLVCFGDGQRPVLENSPGWTWDYDRDRYRFGNRTELTAQQFDASIMVQIWDGGGRVKLPKQLIPPIHSRGDGAWWDLYNVASDPDRITGEYRLNGLNKPRVTIDRRSGRITIVGTSSYGFRGTCDVIDGREQRRF